MAILRKELANLQIILLTYAVFLMTMVAGNPSNEITWVKWDTVWNDQSSLIPAGYDSTPPQQPMYLARVHPDVQNNLRIYPAKWIPGHNKDPLYWITYQETRLFWDKKHFPEYKVELLKYAKGGLHWVYVQGSREPKDDMLPVGREKGETIYACRIYIAGDTYHVIHGSYKDSVGQCCVPKYGEMRCSREHEVFEISTYGRLIGAKFPPDE